MADFHTNEYHQNVEEYFPLRSKLGGKSVSAAAMKALAAVASAVLAAALMLTVYVDCFALDITACTALLSTTVVNAEEDTEVIWQLFAERNTSVSTGRLATDKENLYFTGLTPGTEYTIFFYVQNTDGNKKAGEYRFITGTEHNPRTTPVPGATTPPAPVSSPSPRPERTATPAPTVAPTVTPAVTPTPAATPRPARTTQPAATPKPTTPPVDDSADMPRATADTPVPRVTHDGNDLAVTVTFPFVMNSDADYENTPEKIDIEYTVAQMDGTVYDSGTYTERDTDTASLSVTMPEFGGITADAVLTYTSGNISTGDETTGRTVSAQQFVLSALYLNETPQTTTLTADADNATLAGTPSFTVETGPYTSTYSGSVFQGDRVLVDIYDARGNLVGSQDADATSLTSTGGRLTVPFSISLAGMGLIAGTEYTAEISFNGWWMVDSYTAQESTATASGTFTYGQAPAAVAPQSLSSDMSGYIAPTSGSGNGYVVDYSFVHNDGTVTAVTIKETITTYSPADGTVESTSTSSTEYTDADFIESDDGTYMYVTHTGSTATSLDNNFAGYYAVPVISYTLPDDSTVYTVEGRAFELEPYFYTTQSADTVTVGNVTLNDDGTGIVVDFTADISPTHTGTAGIFECEYASVYLRDNTYLGQPQLSDIGQDGTARLTGSVTVPLSALDRNGSCTLQIEATGSWYVDVADMRYCMAISTAGLSADIQYTP